MKNIQQIRLDKYADTKYEPSKEGIFKNQDEGVWVFAIRFEREANETSQYPLEDLLDKFGLYVSDFIDEAAFYTAKNITLELAGALQDVQNARKAIVGKRIYNIECTREDGQVYVKLAID